MHAVNVKLTTNVVKYKDVEIQVHEDGRKLGTLLVSRGNIEWRPAWKAVKKHRLSWRRFAEVMASKGRTITAKRRRRK